MNLRGATGRAGVNSGACPRVRGGHRKDYTVRECVQQRYLCAGSDAGVRVDGSRPIATAKSLAVHYRFYHSSLQPGAAGEMLGYWLGRGDVIERIR